MIELHPTDIAHGGEAVARLGGKAHFVDGAMPGEVVRGEVIADKPSWARVELREVVEASPDRVEPPCPFFGECGGCQWQFADYSAQLDWKRSIIAGQLAHLGGIEDPPVRDALAAGPPYGYRNRTDFTVHEGRPALRRRKSRKTVPIDRCLLMDPSLAALLDGIGPLTGVTALTVRVSTTTGESSAVVTGDLPAGIDDWECTVSLRTGRNLTPVLGSGVIHETVTGVPLRITGDAFFQNNTRGAGILVGLVTEAVAPTSGETMLDGYAGGGLFGITVGRSAARVLAVEGEALAASDLAANASASGIDVQVVRGAFEKAHLAEPWQVAVVDPPRTGLREAGVRAVTNPRPRAIAYVSCDPASLARDSRLLAERGYVLDWAAPVDLFPQTFHIETVAAFSSGA